MESFGNYAGRSYKQDQALTRLTAIKFEKICPLILSSFACWRGKALRVKMDTNNGLGEHEELLSGWGTGSTGWTGLIVSQFVFILTTVMSNCRRYKLLEISTSI